MVEFKHGCARTKDAPRPGKLETVFSIEIVKKVGSDSSDCKDFKRANTSYSSSSYGHGEVIGKMGAAIQ